MNGTGNMQDISAETVPPGWTYFVRVGASIKIGSATNFKKRLDALQTAHENPIEVLAVVPASVADEFSVHQRFAALRTRGEWFRADRELLDFIENIKEDAKDIPGSPAWPESAKQDGAFDIVSRQLHALRRARHGSPAGRRASNLIGMIANYRSATDEDRRGALKKNMMDQMTELRELMSG